MITLPDWNTKAAVTLSSWPAVVTACRIISLDTDVDAGTVKENNAWRTATVQVRVIRVMTHERLDRDSEAKQVITCSALAPSYTAITAITAGDNLHSLLF